MLFSGGIPAPPPGGSSPYSPGRRASQESMLLTGHPGVQAHQAVMLLQMVLQIA